MLVYTNFAVVLNENQKVLTTCADHLVLVLSLSKVGWFECKMWRNRNDRYMSVRKSDLVH
jgi:hypothetical protein